MHQGSEAMMVCQEEMATKVIRDFQEEMVNQDNAVVQEILVEMVKVAEMDHPGEMVSVVNPVRGANQVHGVKMGIQEEMEDLVTKVLLEHVEMMANLAVKVNQVLLAEMAILVMTEREVKMVHQDVVVEMDQMESLANVVSMDNQANQGQVVVMVPREIAVNPDYLVKMVEMVKMAEMDKMAEMEKLDEMVDQVDEC